MEKNYFSLHSGSSGIQITWLCSNLPKVCPAPFLILKGPLLLYISARKSSRCSVDRSLPHRAFWSWTWERRTRWRNEILGLGHSSHGDRSYTDSRSSFLVEHASALASSTAPWAPCLLGPRWKAEKRATSLLPGCPHPSPNLLPSPSCTHSSGTCIQAHGPKYELSALQSQLHFSRPSFPPAYSTSPPGHLAGISKQNFLNF